MKLWFARFFISAAFSLLLGHNLIAHHHDDQAVDYHHQHHDHQKENSATPFDNVKLDGDFVQKLNFTQIDSCVPVNLIIVQYNFIQVYFLPVQKYFLYPPESPPLLYKSDAFRLRGPPVYA